MHQFRCADDRIDRTRLYAQRAADALLFLDQRDSGRFFGPEARIERFRWNARDRGNLGESSLAGGRALVDVSSACCNRFGIGTASCVAALAALCLRQDRVDRIGQ
jgi:hypothetical protein